MASGVIRGCGTRVHGGVYAESKTGPGGSPIELFLVDPPHPVDMEAMGISPIGVSLIERENAWHIFDYIGEQHYPNVADFIEEARRFGASRRLPTTLNFSKLTDKSRLVLIHRKAIIQPDERMEYHLTRQNVIVGVPGGTTSHCPKNIEAHKWPGMSDAETGAEKFPANPMCAGLWWEDIDDGAMDLPDHRPVTRQMPSFTYKGWRKPDGLLPRYATGIFCVLPITNLCVIRDPNDPDNHRKAFDKAAKAHIATEVHDE